jgi:hypothetical protein
MIKSSDRPESCRANRESSITTYAGEELTKEGDAIDFDVVTELGFPDRAVDIRVSYAAFAQSKS